MPAISRALATLRVIGVDLDPAEITRLLACAPTRAHRKGDDLQKDPAKASNVARSGLWALEAKRTAPADVNSQIGELLSLVTADLSVWTTLASSYKLSVLCAWFMEEGNEGEDLSPETIRALGDRGIALGKV